MLKVIDVAMTETAVLMPEKDLRQIIADGERYEALFYNLLRTCIVAVIRTRNAEIERWIGEHYLELRSELPDDLKQLYLRNIAFREK